MKKFIGVFLTAAFILSFFLSEYDPYYGSWAFYAVGSVMVVLGFVYKGEANSTSCFWTGLFIVSVTFVAANVSGNIYSESAETQKKQSMGNSQD